HATSDGVVVVHHDPGVRRGVRMVEIAETLIDGLGTLDGGGPARLADVLAMVPANRTVYAEIKGHGIERLVADCVAAAPQTVRCAVHSFDHGAIEVMRDIAPNIPRGVLFENDTAGILDVMARTGARDVWPNWKLVDASLVHAVHDAGGRVIVWTVNDVDVARRLSEIGVDGLCGDDVRLFSDS